MKKMNQRTKSILLIILGIVTGIGLISYQFNGQSVKNDPVQSGQVEQAGDEPEIAAAHSFIIKKEDLQLVAIQNASKAIEWQISGRVVPKNTTQLFSEVQGKVQSHSFRLKEGISFRKGDILLQLDSKEFALQLEAQRSAFLNILTGMMPDLKADYPDNYENWLKYVRNYQSGQSLSPLPTTRSDGEKYFVTSNQIYSNYYNIKAQEERLEKFRIVAPYNGLVTEALADEGSLVSPGQMLGKIINNRSFELEAAASLEVASKLQMGDRITFRSNEIEGQWTGKVLRINDIVDRKTQNIPVYFQISGARLKAGMYLEGSLYGTPHADVFAIPATALTRDDKVLLLSENVITGKKVELVDFMRDSILVRGLSDNDLMITNQFEVPVEGLKLSL